MTQSMHELQRKCGLGESGEGGKWRKWNTVEISSLINAPSQLSLTPRNKVHKYKPERKRCKRKKNYNKPTKSQSTD